jgi:hypothetical protein
MKFTIEGHEWSVERVRSMFTVKNGPDVWEFDEPAYDGALPDPIGVPDDTDEYWIRVAQEAVIRYLAAD